MRVINLFAGPGVGKSFTRAGLFFEMKLRGFDVEEVTEYAKDITWDKHFNLLEDQLYILAEQNRRLKRLSGQVEWAITDSPIVLGLGYVKPGYLPLYFKELTWELFNTYDNYNFFIERNESKYIEKGRNQTLEEAKQLDNCIKKLLEDNNIKYTSINGKGRNYPKKILNCITPN